jgi:hypothetical protein
MDRLLSGLLDARWPCGEGGTGTCLCRNGSRRPGEGGAGGTAPAPAPKASGSVPEVRWPRAYPAGISWTVSTRPGLFQVQWVRIASITP